MWNYSDKVKDHFFNPRNAKVLPQANAIGDVGSLSCGDALRLMLDIDPQDERILDAGFQTFGCGSAIAASSALTELIIGKTLNEAATLTNQAIADYLDGLPAEKMHCSVMGCEALAAAIANYRGDSQAPDHADSPLICRCFAVDEAKIVRAVTENQLTTLEQILNYTKAGGGCGACHEKIERVLQHTLAQQHAGAARAPHQTQCHTAATAPVTAAPAAAAGDLRKQPLIDALAQLRPRLQADGGDVELVTWHGNTVVVALSGSCLGCAMSDMTLSWVQQHLAQQFGPAIQVRQLLQPDVINF